MLYNFFSFLCNVLGIKKPHRYYLKFLTYMPDFLFIRRYQGTIRLMGIDFPNRVGISIKDNIFGDYFGSLAKLGFGFIEAGVVTPKGNKNNTKVNSNKGVNHLLTSVKNIANRSYVIGVNIGSDDETPINRAVYDHVICMRSLYLYVDYMVFAFKESLLGAPQDYINLYQYHLHRLKQEQKFLTNSHKKYVPIVIDIPIYLSNAILLEIIHEIVSNDIDGVVVQLTCGKNQDPKHLDEQRKFIIDNIPINIPIFFRGETKILFSKNNIPNRNRFLLLLQELPEDGGKAVKYLVHTINRK